MVERAIFKEALAASLMKNSYSRIKHSERLLLGDLRWDGCSVRSIAKKLGRSPSTILREIKRNGQPRVYDADHAERVAMHRRKQTCRRERIASWLVRGYVHAKLKLGTLPNRSLVDCRWNTQVARQIMSHLYIYNNCPELFQYLPRKKDGSKNVDNGVPEAQ